MDRRVRVRFAPSPTGPLHIGGVRTALYNYLFARQQGGDMLLRIEDTDQNRYVPGAEEYIIEALNWVGIKFDEGPQVGGPCGPYRQSERKAMYRQYADQLINDGYAYYAFDTAEELDEMRERLKSSGMAAQYDAITRSAMKNSLTLPEDEVKRRLESGEPYVIRIKLPRKEDVRFHDIIRGWVTVNTSQMDDKVLFKSDGMPTYHLANIVDDYLMKITHVIRGEEWLPSAPLHVMLYRYLGWESVMPAFAHLPLLLKPEGNGKLSKRDGDRLGFPVFPLQWKDPVSGETSSGYRETGYYPEAVVNMLALLGWHPSDNQEMFSMDELIAAFSLERVSKHGAKFDHLKAQWFNQQYLRARTGEELASDIRPVVAEMGYQADESYLVQVCNLMKEKVSFTRELITQGEYFFKDPAAYDQGVVDKKWKGQIPVAITELGSKLNSLPEYTTAAVEQVFHDVVTQFQLKTGDVMQPFRLVLSGVAGGPPIFEMTALLGRETVNRRINKALQTLKPNEATA